MSVRCFTSILRGRSLALVALAIALMVATNAHATIVFTSNLSDEPTPPAGGTTGTNFQLNYMGGTVLGISNTSPGGVLGFNFIYSSPFQANAVGAYSDLGAGQVFKLDSAITADTADTQDNGYFLALDSVFDVAAIDINISTIAGDLYTVTFDWGGTQAVGYNSSTTDFLTLALGSDTPVATSSVAVSGAGFTGWDAASISFTATTTGSEVLSFLAGGTPSGTGQMPAVTLLDNINVSQTAPSPTPEPSSLMLLSTGLIGLGGLMRWRYKKSEATSL